MTSAKPRTFFGFRNLYEGSEVRRTVRRATQFETESEIDPQANFVVHGRFLVYAPVSLGCLNERNAFRQLCVWLSTWHWWDRFVLLIILANAVLLAIEDYSPTAVDPATLIPDPSRSAVNAFIASVEPLFTALFTFEAAVKIIAMGFVVDRGSYLRDGFNVLDFIVVLSSLFSSIPGVPRVSALRAFRVLRPLRTLSRVKSMRIMVGSLMTALPQLGNVALLMGFLFLFWGIIAVQLFAGQLHGRCRITSTPLSIPDSHLRQWLPNETAPWIVAGDLNGLIPGAESFTYDVTESRHQPLYFEMMQTYFWGESPYGFVPYDPVLDQQPNASLPLPAGAMDATANQIPGAPQSVPWTPPPFFYVTFAQAAYYVASLTFNRTAFPECGASSPGAHGFPPLDASWRQDTSPWSTPQHCVWPSDLDNDRVCDTGLNSGANTCKQPMPWSTDMLTLPSIVAAGSSWAAAVLSVRRAPRTCGSPYDATGNPRFSDARVMRDEVTTDLNTIENGDWILPAFIFMLESVTLESWSLLMYNLQDGYNVYFASIYCVLLTLLGSYIILNLIVATILMQFSTAQATELEALRARKEKVAAIRAAEKEEVSRAISKARVVVELKTLGSQPKGVLRRVSMDRTAALSTEAARAAAEVAAADDADSPLVDPSGRGARGVMRRRIARQLNSRTSMDGSTRRMQVSARDEAGAFSRALSSATLRDGTALPHTSPMTQQRSGLTSELLASGTGLPPLPRGSSRPTGLQSVMPPVSSEGHEAASPPTAPQGRDLAPLGVARQRMMHRLNSRLNSLASAQQLVTVGEMDYEATAGAAAQASVPQRPGAMVLRQRSLRSVDSFASGDASAHEGGVASAPTSSMARMAPTRSIFRGDVLSVASGRAGDSGSVADGASVADGGSIADGGSVADGASAALQSVAELVEDDDSGARSSTAGAADILVRVSRPFRVPPGTPASERLRMWLLSVLGSGSFGLFMMCLIVLNTIVLALDRYPVDAALVTRAEQLNFALTLVFACEMLAKASAMGLSAYIQDRMNIFDAIVVWISLIELVVSPPTFITGASTASNNAAVLALRTLRLARIFKLARSWTSLRLLLRMLSDSMQDIVNFSVLLILFLFITALFGEELFANRWRLDPKTLEPLAMTDPRFWDPLIYPSQVYDVYARGTFDSVWWGMMSSFQIMTLQNWTDQLMPAYRSQGWLGVLYICTIAILGGFVMLDLFLAIMLGHFEGLEQDENKKKPDSMAPAPRGRAGEVRSTAATALPPLRPHRSAAGPADQPPHCNLPVSNEQTGSFNSKGQRNVISSSMPPRLSSGNRRGSADAGAGLLPGEFAVASRDDSRSRRSISEKPWPTEAIANDVAGDARSIRSGRSMAKSMRSSGRRRRRSSIAKARDRTVEAGRLLRAAIKRRAAAVRDIVYSLGDTNVQMCLLSRRAAVTALYGRSLARRRQSGSSATLVQQRNESRSNMQQQGEPATAARKLGDQAATVQYVHLGVQTQQPPMLRGSSIGSAAHTVNTPENNNAVDMQGGAARERASGGVLPASAAVSSLPHAARLGSFEGSAEEDGRSRASFGMLSSLNTDELSSRGRGTVGSGASTEHEDGSDSDEDSGEENAPEEDIYAEWQRMAEGISAPSARTGGLWNWARKTSVAAARLCMLTFCCCFVRDKAGLKSGNKKTVNRSCFVLTERHPLRRLCIYLSGHPRFDSLVLLVIFASSLCLALDSPTLDPDSGLYKTLAVLDVVWVCFFTFEMAVRLVALGVGPLGAGTYLRSGWNVLDGAIVAVSWLSFATDGNASFRSLRALRALRALRPLRVVRRLPGLRLVVHSLFRAFWPVLNVVLVCSILFLIFA